MNISVRRNIFFPQKDEVSNLGYYRMVKAEVKDRGGP
jgi:hypothetical protein